MLSNKEKEILENEKLLEKMLSIYHKLDIPIILKTCNQFIRTGNSNNPLRAGRFYLNKDEHLELTHKKGYYLFLLKNNNKVIGGSLISAKQVTFTKSFAWGFVINV